MSRKRKDKKQAKYQKNHFPDQTEPTALIKHDDRQLPLTRCANVPEASGAKSVNASKSPKVLIPVNDQDSALYALESAMARVWPDGTEFRLLTVIEDLLEGLPELQPGHKNVLQAEQAEYRQSMEDWLKRLNNSFSVRFSNTKTDIESGRIPETICESASIWEADYILVGSHDLNCGSRIALGSISSKVLQSSPCDIEAVRFRKLRQIFESGRSPSPEEIRNLASQAPRRIIVATDFSEKAGLAVDWVANSNWLENTEIKLVTVTAVAKIETGVSRIAGAPNYFSAHRNQAVIQNQLRALGREIISKQPQCKVEAFVLESNSVSDAILDLASSWDVDLVVVGAQGAGAQGAGCNESFEVGSNATKIMDNLECSVIAIKQSPRAQVHFSWFAGLQRKEELATPT